MNHFRNVITSDINSKCTLMEKIFESAINMEMVCMIRPKDNITKCSSYTTELIIKDKSCNSLGEFSFSNYPKLRVIVIGKSCFQKCGGLSVDGMTSLQSLVIGDNCFIGNTGASDGKLIIRECPELMFVDIGSSSFTSTKTVNMIDLPSLSLLNLPSHGFPNGNTLMIKNCPSICQLEFPNGSFKELISLTVDRLSSLSRIRFGVNSCVGNRVVFTLSILSILIDVILSRL